VRVFKERYLHGGHRQGNIATGHKLAAVCGKRDAGFKRLNRPPARFFVRAPGVREGKDNRARAV
jgi:hypothetical protein